MGMSAHAIVIHVGLTTIEVFSGGVFMKRIFLVIMTEQNRFPMQIQPHEQVRENGCCHRVFPLGHIMNM